MASFTSSSVTPLRRAKSRWNCNCSVLPIAVSAATVTRLLSRFDNPSRSQTSSNSTRSV